MTSASTDRLATVLSVAVLGVMALRLVSGARAARSGAGRTLVRAVCRRIRWRHVWPVPIVLTGVVTVATALMLVPWLRWGWWSEIGGAGNPVLGSSETTAGTVWEWLVPLAFVALLVPALPLFAHAEERMFRAGAERWSTRRRIAKTVQFGAVHAVIGIPIGAALALSVGGAWFLSVYLRAHHSSGSAREATLQSAAAHTAYNGVLLGVVVVALAFTAAWELA